MNETVSSSIDSRYHRARCPVCAVTCEQRRRSVLLPGDDKQWLLRPALDCLECEAVYLVATEPAAPTTEEQAQP